MSNFESKKNLSAFQLTAYFKNTVSLAKIENRLHFYNGKFFVPLSSEELESKILTVVQSYDGVSMSKIREIAFFIKRDENIPQYSPAEEKGFIGFQNGVLNCSSETLQFYDYKEAETLLKSQKIALRYCYGDINYSEYKPQYDPYSPYSKCSDSENDSTPITDKFFQSIAGQNRVLIIRIWEMLGYLISADMGAKRFFLLQGIKDSGKSVLGHFIQNLFPMNTISTLDLSQLGGTYLPESFVGSRLNLSMDLEDKVLSTKTIERLKLLTGNDSISQDIKFKDSTSYRGTCKFLFSPNYAIRMNSWDDAFHSRIICIPFSYHIPPNQQDRNLLSKLESEKEHIVAKALYFYRRLKEHNYLFSGQFLLGQKVYDNFPPQISYNLGQDVIMLLFGQAKCCFQAGSSTHSDELYHAYLVFCKENGFTPVRSVSGFAQRFSAAFADLVTPSNRWRDDTKANKRGFNGVALLPNSSAAQNYPNVYYRNPNDPEPKYNV